MEIQKWQKRITHASSVQKKYNEEYGWDRAEQQYRGRYQEVMPHKLKSKRIVPINEVRAYVKTLVPQIYSRNPYITVNPHGEKNVRSAKLTEGAINSYWRELQIKRQIRRLIVDAILGPWGWIKIGYSAIFGKIENETDSKLEVNEYIRDEEIFATRVSWKDIIYDPAAVDPPHDCRWMAHKITKLLAAVKDSDLYKNTKNLKASFYGTHHELYKEYRREPDITLDDEYVTLWEIWDKDTQKVYVIADDQETVLMEKDWPYNLDGFPFYGLTFDINPDENYPQNDIAHWENQLWEKILLRSMQLDHIKRFGRQLIADRGALTKEEENKFVKGDPGIVYKEKGKEEPKPVQYPPIQPDIYAVANSIDLDKDVLSGMSNIVKAAPQKTQSRTLGELDRLMVAFESRSSDPQMLIEDFCENIARGIICLMKDFISLEKYARLTQTPPREILQVLGEHFDGNGFVYTKEDLQGDYDIKVKVGSTLPMNKENRLRSTAQILKLAPAIGVSPEGKTSKVIGKNIMSDLELDEVAMAFEEDIIEADAERAARERLAQAQGAGLREKIEARGGQ